jgi:hypothetical protein
MLQLRLKFFYLNHPQEESSATFKKIQKIKIGREAWARLLGNAEKMILAHREGRKGEREYPIQEFVRSVWLNFG